MRSSKCHWLLLVLVMVAGCQGSPKNLESNWTMEPLSADENLKVDEAFLKKAQEGEVDETAASRRRRRSFLNP